MGLEDFLLRWQSAGPAERANKDLFLSELCRVLDVEQPRPKTNDPEKDIYVFEKDVSRPNESGASIGRIDPYRAGCFVLEAKQIDAAKRETPAWHQAMNDALGQALGYARSLPSPPPFVVVCDIGYCFDLLGETPGKECPSWACPVHRHASDFSSSVLRVPAYLRTLGWCAVCRRKRRCGSAWRAFQSCSFILV